VRVFNWSDNIFGRPFVPFELLELVHHVLLHEDTFDIVYFLLQEIKKTRLIAHRDKATRVNKLSIKTLEVFVQVGYHFFFS